MHPDSRACPPGAPRPAAAGVEHSEQSSAFASLALPLELRCTLLGTALTSVPGSSRSPRG